MPYCPACGNNDGNPGIQRCLDCGPAPRARRIQFQEPDLKGKNPLTFDSEKNNEPFGNKGRKKINDGMRGRKMLPPERSYRLADIIDIDTEP